MGGKSAAQVRGWKDLLLAVIKVAVAAGLADIDGVDSRNDEVAAIASLDGTPLRHRRFESFG